ncbi:MAG: hemolysin III family protein [Nonlabens sp.]
MGREQTAVEERWNVITHGLGILLFLLATIYLFINSSLQDPYIFWGIAIYSGSQLFLYSSSTSYHYATRYKIKFQLRKLDHVSIYFSIAGTYTPICLTSLWDGEGLIILIAVWSIAAFGTIWKLFFTGKYEAFSGLLYLVMGWLVVIDLDGLVDALSKLQLNLLIAGGVFFTLGIIFYAWRKLFFNHVIWHVFVLAGSISHLLLVASVVTK